MIQVWLEIATFSWAHADHRGAQPTVCRCWHTSMQLCLCWKFALAAAISKSSLKNELFPKPFHNKDGNIISNWQQTDSKSSIGPNWLWETRSVLYLSCTSPHRCCGPRLHGLIKLLEVSISQLQKSQLHFHVEDDFLLQMYTLHY